MEIKLFKIELLILDMFQKGIGGRLVRVENNKEEKLVCPMNLYEINASLNIPESELTVYLNNLNKLKLLQSAMMKSHNLSYYWISAVGLELLNSHDNGRTSIKLIDDKYFKKLIIEKSINIIRDSLFDKFYNDDNDLKFSFDTIDKDISKKIINLLSNPNNLDANKNEINNLLDEQAQRFSLPSLKVQKLNRKYKKLSVNNLLPLNNRELLEFKEHLKNLSELKSTFLFSKDQSELREDGSAFLLTNISPDLAKFIFQIAEEDFPFSENEKLFLNLAISKYAYLPDIIYIASLSVQNDKIQCSIGYTVSNNFRFLFESLKRTMKGKMKFYRNINTPLKRFNLIFDKKSYLLK